MREIDDESGNESGDKMALRESSQFLKVTNVLAKKRWSCPLRFLLHDYTSNKKRKSVP